jgi:HK97 family phage prohead protease
MEPKKGEKIFETVSLGIIDKSAYKQLGEKQDLAGFEFDEIFVISTRSKDRHGDIIEQVWELDNYNQTVKGETSGPVLINHMSMSLPVGKGYAWIEDGKLMSGVKFADEIDTYDIGKTVAALVRGNFIKNASVGFMPIEWERLDEDGESMMDSYRFLRSELLEWSVVNVPANPDAQRKMISKGFDLDNLEKAGLIQMDKSVKDVNEVVKDLKTKNEELNDKITELKDISEGRKKPLKAYRNYLKMFAKEMGIETTDNEVKSIEQIFGILYQKFTSVSSEETPSEAVNQLVTLEVNLDSDFGKMVKGLTTN